MLIITRLVQSDLISSGIYCIGLIREDVSCPFLYNHTGHRLKGGRKTDAYNHSEMGQIYSTARDIQQSHASVMSTSSYRYQHFFSIAWDRKKQKEEWQNGTLY